MCESDGVCVRAMECVSVCVCVRAMVVSSSSSASRFISAAMTNAFEFAAVAADVLEVC